MIERAEVPVAESVPYGQTNAYLVGESEPLLVDPAAETERLTRVVERRSVAHIAVTHAHPDHVGGVAAYASQRNATVWARAGYEERFESATGVRPDATFREGSVVGPATVLETPGHAPDHVAFLVGDHALVGDLAVAEGSVFVGGSEGDIRSYLVSLRRLLVRSPAQLLPGHGPEVSPARPVLERLLRHRLDRERRVLAAVRGGARTVDEIVEAAYDRNLSGVADLAALSVEAHLDKLVVAGQVRWDGVRAAPR